MNTAARLVLLSAACLTLSGCVYSDVRMPMSNEFRNTRVVTKSGAASTHSVAWLVAWGDAGLQQAAVNGKLETLEYADRALLNIFFGLYMSNTTVVYGN
jgi:hypothetical protein